MLVMADSGEALRVGELCSTCMSGAQVTNAEAAQARSAIATARNSGGAGTLRLTPGEFESISWTFVPIKQATYWCNENPWEMNPWLRGCRRPPAPSSLVHTD
jgi:hypothetical protein